MNLMELDALIGCCYVCIHCDTEEGTRIARAECEDGAIYLYIYREEGTRMARAECEDGAIYRVGRKGSVWHRRRAKTVL